MGEKASDRRIDNGYSNVIFLQANYYVSNKKNEALMKHAPFFLIFEESALSFDILDFGKRVVRMPCLPRTIKNHK